MSIQAPSLLHAESHAIGTEVAVAVATTLKALAEPLRLRMLSFIATSPAGEACVCDLAALTDVSQPTVSHHLKVLRDVGVLTSERRGTWVWYRITPGYKGAVSTLLESFAPAALEALVAPHEPRVWRTSTPRSTAWPPTSPPATRTSAPRWCCVPCASPTRPWPARPRSRRTC